MMRIITATHAEVRAFLIDYQERQLPWHKMAQFALHLLMCGPCRAWMRKYNDSVELARHYLDDPPPDALVELTLSFLDEHIPERPPHDHGEQPQR